MKGTIPWRGRDYDPCSDGVDGCIECVLNDTYTHCDYGCKFSLEDMEEADEEFKEMGKVG